MAVYCSSYKETDQNYQSVVETADADPYWVDPNTVDTIDVLTWDEWLLLLRWSDLNPYFYDYFYDVFFAVWMSVCDVVCLVTNDVFSFIHQFMSMLIDLRLRNVDLVR